jgi:ParB-like chromosome segregation protein Spo0J
MTAQPKIHPAAELLPLMSEAELAELAADIKKNGLLLPIAFWKKTGELLDGRNRYAACQIAKVPPLTTHYTGDDPVAYVIGANIHRRHLTAAQKRDLIAELLKLDPEKSDRQIAASIKADHKTVAAVRRQKERRGEIPHVAKRTDSKGRSQPAAKTRPDFEALQARARSIGWFFQRHADGKFELSKLQNECSGADYFFVIRTALRDAAAKLDEIEAHPDQYPPSRHPPADEQKPNFVQQETPTDERRRQMEALDQPPAVEPAVDETEGDVMPPEEWRAKMLAQYNADHPHVTAALITLIDHAVATKDIKDVFDFFGPVTEAMLPRRDAILVLRDWLGRLDLELGELEEQLAPKPTKKTKKTKEGGAS